MQGGGGISYIGPSPFKGLKLSLFERSVHVIFMALGAIAMSVATILQRRDQKGDLVDF